MLAVNYSTLRKELKYYCDQATDHDEEIIVTRKDERNVVVMSLERYSQMLKEIRNAQYLDKLDRAIAQIESGKGKVHELIEADDD